MFGLRQALDNGKQQEQTKPLGETANKWKTVKQHFPSRTEQTERPQLKILGIDRGKRRARRTKLGKWAASNGGYVL